MALVLLIAIALYASFAVLVHASPSHFAVVPLHYSDETPLASGVRNQTTTKEHANSEITVAVADNECRSHDAHFSMGDELLTSSNHTLKAKVSRRGYGSDCQNELANTISERNDLVQASKSLKEKIERMERDYAKVLNETWTDMELLEEKVKRQIRTIKSKEERYQDTRKKMLKLDAELRQMHTAARNKYLNFTLIREDAFGLIENTLSKASRRVEKRWSHHHRRLKPRIADTKRRYTRFRRETKPKIMSLRRKMQDRWSRSKIIRPVIEVSWATIARPARAMYTQIQPTIEEAKTCSRLSVTSFIKETSKLALVYLEKGDKLKQDSRERERKRIEDRIHRHNRRLNLQDDTTEKDAKPSLLNTKARVFFRYASANAELLCEKSMALLPLAVALSVTRSGIIGSLSLFCGIPTLIIWVFVIIRVIAKSGQVMQWRKCKQV